MNENENTKAACDAQPSNEASEPAARGFGPAVPAEDRYLSQFSGQRDKDLARNLSGLSAVFGAIDGHRCTFQAVGMSTVESSEQLNGYHHAVAGLLAHSKDLIEQPQTVAQMFFTISPEDGEKMDQVANEFAAVLKDGIRVGKVAAKKATAKKKPAAKAAKAAKATKAKRYVRASSRNGKPVVLESNGPNGPWSVKKPKARGR